MLQLPPIYPITDARRGASLSAQVQGLGEVGLPLVQFRGKPLDAEAQYGELRTALRQAFDNGGWPMICVNDRADLALLAAQEGLEPWGVHLGQEDLPPSEARKLPGLERVHFGTSTHSDAEWLAVDGACDHAGVGPFRATETKPGHQPPIGLEGLRRGCAALRSQGIAPVAIGGLRQEDFAAAFEAGAESVAVAGELKRGSPADLAWVAQAARWKAQPPLRRGQGLVLAGSSGAGKSTLAAALGPRLGLPVQDLDAHIERGAGMPIAEIFQAQGEAAFRRLEREALLRLLDPPCVLSLGGGAWEDPGIREAVRGAGFQALWIAETPAHAWARIAQDPARPLAQDQEAFLVRHRARMRNWRGLPCVLPLGRPAAEIAEAMAAGVD